MRRALVTLALGAALAGVALGGPVAAATGWVAHLYAPGHYPRATKRWPIEITAHTRSGRPLSGTVQYHFLYQGQVVGTRSCHDTGSTPCHFRNGVYRDVLRWPRAAIGRRLTFQAVVKTRLGTKKLNYWVKVRRP